MAQLVARVLWEHDAAGSSPATRTKIRDVVFDSSDFLTFVSSCSNYERFYNNTRSQSARTGTFCMYHIYCKVRVCQWVILNTLLSERKQENRMYTNEELINTNNSSSRTFVQNMLILLRFSLIFVKRLFEYLLTDYCIQGKMLFYNVSFH